MVSGVETGLIIRANSTFAGAAFGQRDDRANPLNPFAGEAAGNASVVALGGAPGTSVIRPFGNGEPQEGEDEGPFFASGLNGLLAPPSIAAIQEENGDAAEEGAGPVSNSGAGIAQPSDPAGEPDAAAASAAGEEETGPGELTDEEEELVQDLKQRDAEVRRHEQAHKAVGGQYAGAISYTYQSGPDGRQYAIGGEVPIDASPIPGDPDATIRKLEQVRRAALAPAEPSGADRAVASQATQGIQQARAEQAQQRAEELGELVDGGDGTESSSDSSSTPAAPGNSAGETAPAAAGERGAFAAEGGLAERSDASPFSIGSSLDAASDGGSFGGGSSGDDAPERGLGIETGGQSPFSFTPSVGRETLDISV